uniref:Secreted protein n=1 Tax=Oryza brachyantha TaxID=4533 RepID=J3NEP1_ORYBR
MRLSAKRCKAASLGWWMLLLFQEQTPRSALTALLLFHCIGRLPSSHLGQETSSIYTNQNKSHEFCFRIELGPVLKLCKLQTFFFFFCSGRNHFGWITSPWEFTKTLKMASLLDMTLKLPAD